MAVFGETTDRLGRKVVLTHSGWDHIVSRHGDMVEHQQQIMEAIEFADEVVRDATYDHREIHYRRRRSSPRWLRVIVHYHPGEPAGWIGRVVTAHFLNTRPRNEVLLWPFQSPR